MIETKQWTLEQALNVCTFITGYKPKFLPDERYNSCPICLRPFQWYWRRRHHCRACGIVVCNTCSNTFLRFQKNLYYNSSDFLRVCDICNSIYLSTYILPKSVSSVDGDDDITKVSEDLIISGKLENSKVAKDPQQKELLQKDPFQNEQLEIKELIDTKIKIDNKKTIKAIYKVPDTIVERTKYSSIRSTLSRKEGGKIANVLEDICKENIQSSLSLDSILTNTPLPNIDIKTQDDIPIDSSRSRMRTMRLRNTNSSNTTNSNNNPRQNLSKQYSKFQQNKENIINDNTLEIWDKELQSPLPQWKDDRDIKQQEINEKELQKLANEIAGRYVNVDIFNMVWHTSPIIIVDIRSKEQYSMGHIPRSINIPLNEDDIKRYINLNELEKRIENSTDARIFRMRNQRSMCICGSIIENVTKDISSTTSVINDIYDIRTSPYIAQVSREVLYLVALQLQEGRVRIFATLYTYARIYTYINIYTQASEVDILADGVEGYINKYKFATCRITTEKQKQHRHQSQFPGYPSEILDDTIYLGSYDNASNQEHLKSLRITYIINVSNDLVNNFPDSFKYIRIEIDDTIETNIIDKFDTLFDTLDTILAVKDGDISVNRILLHCQLGISRSSTFVIGYIMRIYSCSLLHAIGMVRSRRPVVLPNEGFLRQLGEYEKVVYNGIPTYDECFSSLYPGRSG